MLSYRRLRLQIARIFPSKPLVAVFISSCIIVLCAEWLYQFFFFKDVAWPAKKADANVALIADPQLVDKNSYPNRNNLLLKLSMFYTDRYLARNFRLIDSVMKPNAYFFLGDLFDGGREWENDGWNAEYARWQKVFPESQFVERVTALPGNHDVGSASGIRRDAYLRFQNHFGTSTNILQIANHKIVLLDTNLLMDERDQSLVEPVSAFYTDLKTDFHKLDPLILLTHIPLYRPESSSCGPMNEGNPLLYRQGYQYITMVEPSLSLEILNSLKPKYVFSGDHHDFCEHVHEVDRDILETTVKSFSMAGGMKRPGFQLLSLFNDGTHETAPVLLPHPLIPFYLMGGAYSLLLLFCMASCVGTGGDDYAPLPVSTNDRHVKTKRGFFSQLKDYIGWGVLGFVAGEYIIEQWSYSAMY